jgi:hypothetical protein
MMGPRNGAQTDAPERRLQAHARTSQASVGALEGALIAGGDFRLHVDARSGLNGYGCQPSPRPREISFSSSTASTISSAAFAAAGITYRDLCAANELPGAAAQCAAAIKRRLKALCELPSGTEIILSPSGTDAPLHALFLARQTLGESITSIVTAADETGSGVKLAVGGRHFGSWTPSGRPAQKGEPVGALARGVSVVAVNARDAAGTARPMAAVDAEVQRSVAQAIAAGDGVVLHVMDHSKLGSRIPSEECLDEICARWGHTLRVVVDACQTRLGSRRLRSYLDRGFMVIITGSKFFAGPPLSGALLVPAGTPLAVGHNGEMLAGLADYSTGDDWPETCAAIRARLPAPPNIGQLLRWSAALEEMQAFFGVPELFRKLVLKEFSAAAARMIEGHDILRLLPAPEWLSRHVHDADVDDEFDVRTILPFAMMGSGRTYTPVESRLVYEALNRDLSFIPSLRGAGATRDLAAQICHVGQPVGIGQDGEGAVLRVSASARLVSESWSSDRTDGAMEAARSMIGRLETVLAKLVLVVTHVDDVRRHCGPAALSQVDTEFTKR